jgi:hypothetical protein
MPRRVQQVPSAAYFEDYDEDAHVVLPETRRVANVAAKRSRSDLRSPEFGFDPGSDSGYSSRTAATINSGQSLPSGRPSPLALTLDTTSHSRPFDVGRARDGRREKGKQREDKRIPAEMMDFETMRGLTGVRPSARSPSKSKRRESMSMQPPPEGHWQSPHAYNSIPSYHASTPIDPRPMDFPFYPIPPPVHDGPPPSPTSTRYPYPYEAAIHIPHSSQRRPSRSSTYHPDGRPLSFHGMMPEAMYNQYPMSPFEQGPPSAFSAAYATVPSFLPPQASHQQYYVDPSSPHHTVFERPRASSKSRPREKSRRSSMYGPPVVEQPRPTPTYEDDTALDRRASREYRPRRPSQAFGRDEDYYRMPPPPTPRTPKPKTPSTPQVIHHKRPDLTHKPATTGSMPPPVHRRVSQTRDSWDMSELEQALPHQQVRKISAQPLARSQSLRQRRRPTSYHEAEEPARVAIEDSRRRRTTYYGDAERGDMKTDLEQKHRSAEEYQAARSGRTVPLTADALKLKAKIGERTESDSGSHKSRSNSSRGSDARTRDGSGAGSKADDDGSFTMTMNGMTMSFTQESVSGKRIHVRTGDQGAMELNIEGKRPRKYIMPANSDHTSASGKKESEDSRRTRDDRRSDRASRPSSRSTFSGRGFD